MDLNNVQPTSPTSEPIGCIGMGLLGMALAARLRGAGHAIVGYDPDAARRPEAQRLGVMSVASATEVARKCRRIVLCLPDSSVVEQVVQEMEPVLAAGTILMDTTTGDPDVTAVLAERLARQQIELVDAAVAGSSEQARKGEIQLLVGGTAHAITTCLPLLHELTPRIFHLGPPGSGLRMKLVLNLVLGLNRAVLAEGLVLARAHKLDPAQVLEVLRTGPARSAVMETKGAKMIHDEFAPQARLAQHLKDVRLIRQLAVQGGVQLPLTETHQRLLERAVELGWGSSDNSAVIKAWETGS